jgi:hypothetical protein
MPVPQPLIVPWRGRQVRIRHDDPRLTPHSPRAAIIISAAQLAATADGLRRILQATVGEWYAVMVREEPLAVGLRRLPVARGPPGPGSPRHSRSWTPASGASPVQPSFTPAMAMPRSMAGEPAVRRRSSGDTNAGRPQRPFAS